MKVAGSDETKLVTEEMVAVTFAVDLAVGETDIETWFRIGAGKILGAYYLDVRRLK